MSATGDYFLHLEEVINFLQFYLPNAKFEITNEGICILLKLDEYRLVPVIGEDFHTSRKMKHWNLFKEEIMLQEGLLLQEIIAQVEADHIVQNLESFLNYFPRTCLPLLRLKEDAPEHLQTLVSKVREGSAMVGLANRAFCRGKYFYIYYEGGIYSRKKGQEATKEERTEYAKIAAGRAFERYPTVARFGLSLDNTRWFDVIGYVETPGFRVFWKEVVESEDFR